MLIPPAQPFCCHVPSPHGFQRFGLCCPLPSGLNRWKCLPLFTLSFGYPFSGQDGAAPLTLIYCCGKIQVFHSFFKSDLHGIALVKSTSGGTSIQRLTSLALPLWIQHGTAQAQWLRGCVTGPVMQPCKGTAWQRQQGWGWDLHTLRAALVMG